MPNKSFKAKTFLRFSAGLAGLFFSTLCASGCASISGVQPVHSEAKFHALRFGPGTDVRSALTKAATDGKWKAASIVSAVGSLTTYHLRFADQKNGAKKEGRFEIVSLSGLLSESGVHIHASVSDNKGVTTGGHVLDGNIVYTTLELVILELPDREFLRKLDPATGFNELVIQAH